MQTCNFSEMPLKQVLLHACCNVYHDKAHTEPDEYVVWTEVGENTFRAEGAAEKADRYAVTVYTKKEYSEIPDKLRNLFSDADYAWEDPMIMYDEQTGYRSYSYTVEVT